MKQAGIYENDVFCGILTEEMKSRYYTLLDVRGELL